MAAVEPIAAAPAAVVEEKETKTEEPVVPFQTAPPTDITVTRKHPLPFYAELARKILRFSPTLALHGSGNSITTTCTLVEMLKRGKEAEVVSSKTGMDVQPFFQPNGVVSWGIPQPMVTFELKQAELSEYVSGYQRRKLTELFEKATPPKQKVLKFEGAAVHLQLPGKEAPVDLSAVFHTPVDDQAAAARFLATVPGKQLDLVHFLKYASKLVHPLLKPRVFKACLEELGVSQDEAAHKEEDEHAMDNMDHEGDDQHAEVMDLN